ncbi:hypothetical protein O3M35_012874 [Rhynocoris fuscipes]|uniref:Glucose-methanol-choline oxidoreductase N-terminal domain-containing protein n=1 Tax=Rhynocoris fuscipes TaxID=488301 RepID=A0AAW1CGB6_9HEMI
MISKSLFIQILTTMLTKYDPNQLDISQKPLDSSACSECKAVKYDFIIVGAGSAGSVLANRLSKNPEWNILLIEAGQSEDFYTDAPGAFNIGLFNTKYDWNYTTVEQQFACQAENGGKCGYPRGYVMGGTSTINAMMYVRGNAKDFDEWEALGNPGWSYKDVLPYFRKLENMVIPELAKDEHYHSTKGPLSVDHARFYPPLMDDVYKAAENYGLKYVDYNGASQIGISRPQMTLKDGTRCSSSKAYLDPIRNRKNLVIFQNTVATKILFDSDTKKAVGLSYFSNGKEYTTFAKKEVILSAGSINSPKLLLISGIGPKKHLEELKIPVRKNLPVGENLVDHPGIDLAFILNSTETCCFTYTENDIEEYARNKTGPVTSNGVHAIAFLNENNRPENQPIVQIQILRMNESYSNPNLAHIDALMFVSKPKSIGSVRLVDNNWRTAPLIDPKFLSHEDDVKNFLWGIGELFKIIKSPALAKFSPKFETSMAADCFKNNHIDETSLRCFLKNTGSLYHPVGTAKMGPCIDNSTVVDSTLKVHGISNLRVVDASVMPKITSGNTNAPTIMIAEKAADLIINQWGPKQ